MMMDKVDVNGLDAHPVYHYLKMVAGPVRERESCTISNDVHISDKINMETLTHQNHHVR